VERLLKIIPESPQQIMFHFGAELKTRRLYAQQRIPMYWRVNRTVRAMTMEMVMAVMRMMA
jgi:hypothetical protein